MAIKPNNVVSVLQDKLVHRWIDFSAGLTGSPVEFVDFDNDYELIDCYWTPTVNYIGSQATTVKIGNTAGPTLAVDDDRFASQALGTTAIAAGVTTAVTLLTTYKKLPAGTPLTFTSAASASQTGEGIFCVRLRPIMKSRGNVSKRPLRSDVTA